MSECVAANVSKRNSIMTYTLAISAIKIVVYSDYNELNLRTAEVNGRPL